MFDRAINKMVLFGGVGETSVADTWTYDGTTWARQLPATSLPRAPIGATMVYDAALRKVVLFGDTASATGVNEQTWTYDGVTWTQQFPATSPAVLGGASMVFDPRIGKVVLFGGEGFSGLLGDTWTYDGINWTKQSPALSPPARIDAPMAFDSASGDLVLVGGVGDRRRPNCQDDVLRDTWTYDGVIWTRQSPTFRAPAVEEGTIADTGNGRLVLFGGKFVTGRRRGNCVALATVNNTWVYSGGEWSRLVPSINPSAQFGFAMAYDPRTKQLILVGGSGRNSLPLHETWTLRTVGSGYRFVAADGGVFTFDAPYHGSTGNVHLNQPIVGMTADPGTGGYWLAAADGAVFAFDAPNFGSAGNVPLAQPIVGIAAAPNGKGYWLAGADGSIFNYGPGAPRDGAPNGPLQLNRPVVGIAADPTTHGYRLVASDGGVFAFGAQYHGSTGNIHLNQSIVGIASDPATGGYWLVARDGGVFAFDAPFYGSTGNIHLNQPIVGITAAPDGRGYWLVAKDGGIFSFGPGATFHGSTGNIHLNQPIVGMTGS